MKKYEDDELELDSYNDIDEIEDTFEHISRYNKTDDLFSCVDQNDENSNNDNIEISDAILPKLRYELSKPEYKRKEFRFKYKEDYINATPMVEINPLKFVFKIDNKMKSLFISDLEILY